MRYSGGLLGGSWLASFTSDLGNGIFDGVHLVSNFENLDPANTLWSKQYNVYSKVDTEEERFLGFERWFGGHFLLTGEEMRFIVYELFVGNKLHQGNHRQLRPPPHRLEGDPRADRRYCLMGRQHHAAAAGAQLDHRSL